LYASQGRRGGEGCPAGARYAVRRAGRRPVTVLPPSPMHAREQTAPITVAEGSTCCRDGVVAGVVTPCRRAHRRGRAARRPGQAVTWAGHRRRPSHPSACTPKPAAEALEKEEPARWWGSIRAVHDVRGPSLSGRLCGCGSSVSWLSVAVRLATGRRCSTSCGPAGPPDGRCSTASLCR
jgi:hypothetical protein